MTNPKENEMKANEEKQADSRAGIDEGSHNGRTENGNTERTNIKEHQLAALYQSRKQHYHSPQSVKTAMFNKLATNANKQKPWWKIDFSQYLRVSAIAFSLAVAAVIINMQMLNQRGQTVAIDTVPSGMQSADYRTVQLHVMNNDGLALTNADQYMTQQAQSAKQQSAQAQIRVNYETARADYANRQNHALANAPTLHETFATVVKNEDELWLLTCNKDLLKISAQVLDMLSPTQYEQTTPHEIDFTEGQMLSLHFDPKGQIIDIHTQQSKTQCD